MIRNIIVNEILHARDIFNELWTPEAAAVTYEARWCDGTVHIVEFINGRWMGYVNLVDHPDRDDLFMAWTDKTVRVHDMFIEGREALDDLMFAVALDLPHQQESNVMATAEGWEI